MEMLFQHQNFAFSIKVPGYEFLINNKLIQVTLNEHNLSMFCALYEAFKDGMIKLDLNKLSMFYRLL